MHEVASRKARGFSARGFSARGFSARGFSLVEMLLAVFILGVGVISIAALFPAGIVLQRQATDDIIGPLVAKNAFATIRSKLSPSDFGGFNDFGLAPYFLLEDQPEVVSFPSSSTAPLVPHLNGDWCWMRPGFLFGTPADRTHAGTIDIFSAAFTRQELGMTTYGGAKAAEIIAGPIYGIPYNLQKYPLFGMPSAQQPVDPLLQQLIEPAITFTQAERTFPQGNPNYGATSQNPLAATYYWDCMFRRNGGKVQVAVFVYRVTAPGGENRPYVVRPNSAVMGGGTLPLDCDFYATGQTPPIPALYFAPPSAAATRWPYRVSPPTSLPPADEIPGTGINAVDSFGSPEQVWDDWQAPASWWVDNHATTHRVLNGRLNISQGPVRLVRPIPILPRSPVNGVFPSPIATTPLGANAFIRAIWFIPRRDAIGNVITPVFASVEEL